MKKMIDLENKWKAYRYKSIASYIFIVVLIAFIVVLGLFIKFQYDKSIKRSEAARLKTAIMQNPAPQILAPQILAPQVQIPPTPPDSVNAIDFICREVSASKLMVRQYASFKASPIGFYSRGGIFCAQKDIKNGMLQTPNGWISANDAYSKVVEVNMFVDTGFNKYPRVLQASKTTDVKEVKVLDKSHSVEKEGFDNAELAQTPITPAPIIETPPKIEITARNISKNDLVNIKKADFNRTNDYGVAIEIAEFYFKNKDYKNSIDWALKASNADSKGQQKVESWIIYAKSLYKMGKQQQAMDVLNRYISSTNSKEAIDTLNNMRQGII